VPAIADLLDPADRQRLERLGKPDDTRDLAAAARQAARESSGASRLAWACCVTALDQSESPEDARAVLAGMIQDDQLRGLAMACLTTICNDDFRKRGTHG
jgi:hypothetical protein